MKLTDTQLVGADHCVISWAANEPQDYPERTGILVRTERHYGGLEGTFGLLGILPRRPQGHCGASVVTAQDAVATERRIPDETHRHAAGAA